MNRRFSVFFSRQPLAGALVLGCFLSSMSAHAATVSVSGNVVLPPCTLNGGNTIDVNFGDDVMITRIDGKEYKKQPVNYNLSCEGDMSNGNNLLSITISGSVASFGSGLLKTDKSGLGVQFLNYTTPLAVNTGQAKFNYNSSHPTLFAVLAKNSASPPTAGEFSATATMSVNYQ
jgi:type 1 fimbria pilin